MYMFTLQNVFVQHLIGPPPTSVLQCWNLCRCYSSPENILRLKHWYWFTLIGLELCWTDCWQKKSKWKTNIGWRSRFCSLHFVDYHFLPFTWARFIIKHAVNAKDAKHLTNSSCWSQDHFGPNFKIQSDNVICTSQECSFSSGHCNWNVGCFGLSKVLQNCKPKQ